MKSTIYPLLLLVLISSCTKEVSFQKLTVISSPIAGGSISPQSNTYEKGQTVDIVASPNPEFLFKEWRGSVTGNMNPAKLVMDSDKEVTGVFEKRLYPLSLSIEGMGTVKEEVIAMATQGLYPGGTVVKLTAIPDTSSEFIGYEGDLKSKELELIVQVNSARTIKASFEKRNFLNRTFQQASKISSQKIGKNTFYTNSTNVFINAEWATFVKNRFKIEPKGIGVIIYRYNPFVIRTGDFFIEFFYNADDGKFLFARYRVQGSETLPTDKHYFLDEFKSSGALIASLESYSDGLFIPGAVDMGVPQSFRNLSFEAKANLFFEGSGKVSEKGFVLNLTPQPTTSNVKYRSSQSGAGAYTTLIDNLPSNTKFYIRPYGINEKGTFYGNEFNFTTPDIDGGQGNIDFSTVADNEGNIYKTISVGGKIWMAENLNVSRYNNFEPIPNVTNPQAWAALTSGAWSNYGNDVNLGNRFGKLYNWNVANDARRVCPTGWRVPSDGDWTSLTAFLGGEEIAGGRLKERGTNSWFSPNTGAVNLVGYSAKSNGYRNFEQTQYTDSNYFSALGSYGAFWSATSYDNQAAWHRFLFWVNDDVNRGISNKKSGLAIRCVKN
jgi:uncharacterized protein (TIGR02145 family)